MGDVQREINTTRNWGITLLVAFLIPSIGLFVKFGAIEQRLTQAEKDIQRNEQRIDSIEGKIELILVGIEQVKARLGIVEVKP